MNREDLVKRFEELGLIDKEQITQAILTPYSYSAGPERFPVCELKLVGISRKYEADMVSITISLDGSEVKRAEVPVVTGEASNLRVNLDAGSISEFIGKEAECRVSVADKFGRAISSSVKMVQFGEPKVIPEVSLDFDYPDTAECVGNSSSLCILEGTVATDCPVSVSFDIQCNKRTVWQCNTELLAGDSRAISAIIDATGLSDEAKQTFDLHVKSDGRLLLEKTYSVNVPRKSGPVVDQAESFIVGDLTVPDYVDVHTAENGRVSVGSLLLFNKGSESDLNITVSLDGSPLYVSKVHVPEDDSEIEVLAPFSSLSKPETVAHEIVASVTDPLGNIVLYRVEPLRVRSKYDMDLSEICVRSAQFVNPRNPAVEKLVHDSEGPLARCIGGDHSMMGYQWKGKEVSRQMKAVYDMFHGMGMRYLSDTFTFSKTASYQHVKTPDRVLEDRSGNCLELSILYASIIEAMGMEPVIAFPPGHAVVGVVLSTDMYVSESMYTEVEEIPYVTMEIDGMHAQVMFVETTACPWDDDFVDAVCRGYDVVTDNIRAVSSFESCLFVKRLRLMGIDPLLGI